MELKFNSVNTTARDYPYRPIVVRLFCEDKAPRTLFVAAAERLYNYYPEVIDTWRNESGDGVIEDRYNNDPAFREMLVEALTAILVKHKLVS
jgi:hypothetical protein